MKVRSPIIGIIILQITLVILDSFSSSFANFRLYEALTSILGILILVLIGLMIYLIIRNIFRAIQTIITKGGTKNQTSRKLQNIDRALDEIESTLDAMTEAGQEDGKITPIWGAGTKKDR